jgi:hypothetical protein
MLAFETTFYGFVLKVDFQKQFIATNDNINPRESHEASFAIRASFSVNKIHRKVSRKLRRLAAFPRSSNRWSEVRESVSLLNAHSRASAPNS